MSSKQIGNSSQTVILGQRGRGAKVSEFQGKPLFHLRQFYWAKDKNDWFPTKEGITLNYDEFLKMKNTMSYLEGEFKRMDNSERESVKSSYRFHPYAKTQEDDVKSNNSSTVEESPRTKQEHQTQNLMYPMVNNRWNRPDNQLADNVKTAQELYQYDSSEKFVNELSDAEL